MQTAVTKEKICQAWMQSGMWPVDINVHKHLLEQPQAAAAPPLVAEQAPEAPAMAAEAETANDQPNDDEEDAIQDENMPPAASSTFPSFTAAAAQPLASSSAAANSAREPLRNITREMVQAAIPDRSQAFDAVLQEVMKPPEVRPQLSLRYNSGGSWGYPEHLLWVCRCPSGRRITPPASTSTRSL